MFRYPPMGLGASPYFSSCGVPFPGRLWWWVHGRRGRGRNSRRRVPDLTAIPWLSFNTPSRIGGCERSNPSRLWEKGLAGGALLPGNRRDLALPKPRRTLPPAVGQTGLQVSRTALLVVFSLLQSLGNDRASRRQPPRAPRGIPGNPPGSARDPPGKSQGNFL